MTLFSMPHATKVLALSAVIVAGGMTAAATAEEKAFTPRMFEGDSVTVITPRHEKRDNGYWLRGDRDRHHGRRADSRRIHRHWKNHNYYGGGLAAYRDPGNGLYVYVDRDRYYDVIDAPFVDQGGPKVIHVVPGEDGCSWEAGVCVIRPGR